MCDRETTETIMETQTIDINVPRTGSKQAKLVGMLSRKSGVTITKASEALGWQKHTTSATLTSLRKRGYQIERQDRGDKPSVYMIVTEPK